MRRIVILDTYINDTNLGNKIIMEAVCKHLREIFPHDFFYMVPAMEYVRAGRHLIRQADFIFLGGTNLLSSNMNRTSEWRVRIWDIFWMKNVILLGVGWWQYQQCSPNLWTRLLLKGILSKEYYHSVRDSYTADRLRKLGFKVLNTGCPTLWMLDEQHCAAIPRGQAKSALLTFTEYNQRPEDDKVLFNIVRRNYDTVFFWPQMYGDYEYAKAICGSDVIFIPPSVDALDDVLKREDVDYVGTRLHAGIRALQHKRRAIIVAIDNRAVEMGKDFNLPIILRDEVSSKLEEKIKGYWATKVKIDQQAIASWKRQFCDSNTA
jgi:polysaccharide pyruvyl transferase WcaK-like protein